MNRRGGFTDLFLFIIIAFILVLASAIFIYIGNTAVGQMHLELDNMDYGGNANLTQVMNDTIDNIPVAYAILKWASFFIIFFMILSIFYGSYQVTTKPIFFIPYFIIVIVAFILSMVMSNAYEQILTDSDLSTVLAEFVATNFLMLYLPIIIVIVGIVGGIIMYASYKINSQEYLYG